MDNLCGLVLLYIGQEFWWPIVPVVGNCIQRIILYIVYKKLLPLLRKLKLLRREIPHHNCKRWGTSCTSRNCKRMQYGYTIWKLLGYTYTTYEHTCLAAYCLKSCGGCTWKWSGNILVENYKEIARDVRHWFKLTYGTDAPHHCNVEKPDCYKINCGRARWWYPIAVALGFQYGPFYHECGYYMECDEAICPPSEWHCEWKNIFHMLKYKWWNRVNRRKCKKWISNNNNNDSDPDTDDENDGEYVSGSESTAGTMHSSINSKNWQNRFTLGSSLVTKTDEISSIAGNTDTDSETEINYEFSNQVPHLPKLEPYGPARIYDTDLILIYSPLRWAQINLRCRHEPIRSRYIAVRRGRTYICLCHGHGVRGFEYNCSICVHPRCSMIPISTNNLWKIFFLIYDYKGVLTLRQLAMASVLGNEQHHEMFEPGRVPKSIIKNLPPSYKSCLRLGCNRESFDDCTGICRTKLECTYDHFNMV
jgi:hypothetical protein